MGEGEGAEENSGGKGPPCKHDHRHRRHNSGATAEVRAVK